MTLIMNRQKKKFALTADQIKPLATGRGGCIATDRITVEGKPVGYMVREETSRPGDSGWCFMAGDETQEYMDDSTNYSPDIVAFLDSPPRTAFARISSGKLIQVPYEEPLE